MGSQHKEKVEIKSEFFFLKKKKNTKEVTSEGYLLKGQFVLMTWNMCRVPRSERALAFGHCLLVTGFF